MPSFQVETTFLGQPCGTGWTHGVNPEMQHRLQAAERTIAAAFEALPPEKRIAAFTGSPDASFEEWCGVDGPHLCWLPNAAQHSAGAAVDINPAANPYIVTRHEGVPGGEPGGEDLVEMRRRALAVFDRAMQFRGADGADVEARRAGETTAAVWDRFRAVSEALVAYLGFAIDPEPADVARDALEDADAVGDDELLAAIPEGERLPLEPAVERLAAHLRGGAAGDPRAVYLRILRDYEMVRIPLVLGTPSAAPARTRNPARGFLHLPREVVCALCDQGLRWGACDFPIRPDGTSDNGAMMHFDLEDCGGYPEINSLLRFG